MSEHVRQCRACGRPASHIGNACAYCGGELVARQAPPSGGPCHPQVMAAAVTFCLGLLLVRVLLVLWGPGHLRSPLLAWDDPLMVLEAIAIGATLLYLLLRSEEGDFRALFLVSLALFVGEEGLGFLARTLGLRAFQELGLLMSFAVAIYSSLAVTAGAYDRAEGPPDPKQSPYLVVSSAIFFLAGLRALEGAGVMARYGLDKIQEAVGLAVLAAVVGYLAIRLVRPPFRRSDQTPAAGGIGKPPEAKPEPPAAPAEDAGGGETPA